MNKILFSIKVLLMLMVLFSFSAEADKFDEVWKRQEERFNQYQLLEKNLLRPAGVMGEFLRFKARNPRFFRDSFTRSRTADQILKLLKENPAALAVFEKCGLSKPGEYFCRERECQLHRSLKVNSKFNQTEFSFEFKPTLLYLFSGVAGIILFVFITGTGSKVCAWLDKKFPEKK